MTMTAARIRIAAEGDARMLSVMSRDTIEEGLPWRYREPEMLRFIRSPRYNVIIADDEDGVAGFAVMGYGENDAYLALLAVIPPARRRGYAGNMLDWLLKTAGVAGVEAVTVELREDNTVAHHLYESRGFTVTGRRAGGYYGVVNQNRMRLQLRDPAASS